ncbi:MAG: diaminopimelate decarboxylase [Verrucomicrobiales bacterium]|nr:diaminopimelate decarboxylase [Verrucomicrobiales bacterium]
MHGFEYRNGELFCEQVGLRSLAETHGTPLYVYSAGTIRDHFTRLNAGLAGVDHLVCYAVKANSNLAVLNLLARLGSGFDIVSGGELFRVVKAGGDPASCTFAGVGKTREEIEYALQQGVYSINVESEAELRYINKVAGAMGRQAPVAVRLNPNVDARSHAKISTGKNENKFGIEFDQIASVYERAAKDLPHVRLRGAQMHIGSQITSVEPFVQAVEKAAPLVAELKAAHGLEFFSIGGGIGIVYQDSLASGASRWWKSAPPGAGRTPLTIEHYTNRLLPLLQPLGLRILLEPGRLLVGNAGVLLTKVLYEKQGSVKSFKIVDAGMNDLIRPTLYEGHHEIAPLQQPPQGQATELVDVVGPICESGDFLAQNREMPPVKTGDLLAVMSAGAYGFVMASNYNSRPLPAEILVDGTESKVIRRRQTLDDLIADELAVQ